MKFHRSEMAGEKRRSEAFVKEVMNAFHMDESDATVVALSMLIRELVLAAQAAEAVA